MFCWKKDPLYKNPNAKIVNVTNSSIIDFNNKFSGMNFRPKQSINYDLENEKLVGSKDILRIKTNISPSYFNDNEVVIEYKDVVIFNLACQSYTKNYIKPEYRVKNVLIDKTYNLLIIFDDIDEMFKYISGHDFKYSYGIFLNSYINLSLCKKKKINKINFEINKKNSYLFEIKLIENDNKELTKFNINNHFNNFIKIKKLFRFSSVYPNKIKLFKETIEKIVGFKIIYDM